LKTKLLTGLGLLLLLAGVAAFLGFRPDFGGDKRQAQETLESGISLFNQKQYVEALSALEQVPAGSPQEARAFYYRGSAQIMLKDYESAVRELEQALALEPGDAGTLYGLGVAYFKLGNLKLSKSYFAAVLEINPNDEQARGLMDIMAKLERQSEAAPAPESEDETGN
jgi:tetratricopeptide (TPR) repeat protein